MAATGRIIAKRLLILVMKNKFIVAFTLTLLSWSASARTISWFNAEGDVLVSSGGNSTLDASFTFEIGSFGTFIPTDLNLDQWAANWKVFDRAVSGDGWNSTTGYFTSSAQFQSNGQSNAGFSSATFTAGEIAYLWVYNSLDLLPSTEWALVRDSTNDVSSSWVIPTSDINNPNSIDWDLLEANSAVFGQINGAVGAGHGRVDRRHQDLAHQEGEVNPLPLRAAGSASTALWP